MKSKQLLFSIAFTALTASVLFMACSKSNSVGGTAPTASQQSVSLYLADGPGIYNHVYLDVKSITVLVDTSANTRDHDRCNWDSIGQRRNKPDSSLIWENLNFNAGVYDLLQLRNGIDTLLSTTNVIKGTVRMIRIDLGTNNSVVVDSVSHPLLFPPNAPSYFLVKLNGEEWEHYASNASRLWIDFDVARSIIFLNNAYYLAPFFHTFVPTKSGAITGHIEPQAAFPELVTVYSATDTAYALPNPSGNFMVRGLKNGTYSALIHSLRTNSSGNLFNDTTINNIVIQNANTVSLGNITLH